MTKSTITRNKTTDYAGRTVYEFLNDHGKPVAVARKNESGGRLMTGSIQYGSTAPTGWRVEIASQFRKGRHDTGHQFRTLTRCGEFVTNRFAS